MRMLAIGMILLSATITFAQAPSPDRASILNDAVTTFAQHVDRELLLRNSLALVQRQMHGSITKITSDSKDALTLSQVQNDVLVRVTGVYGDYYRTAPLQDEIREWVDRSFTTSELEEIIRFAKTDAGRKFFMASSDLYRHLLVAADRAVEKPLAEALYGADAETMLRMTAIRRTAADMRSIATAAEAYATDHNRYPQATDIAALKALLVPRYIRHLPEKDAWGEPYRYEVSSDGAHYRIVSGGADRVVDAEHRSMSFGSDAERRFEGGDDASGDFVFEDGAFRAAPKSLPGMMSPPRPPRPPQAREPQPRQQSELPTVPPGYLRVGGDVKPPIVIHRVEPYYPEEARAARIAGIVIIEALVDAEGRVTGASVLKPLPFGLDQAAADAVKQWKFRPGTLSGVAVPTVFNLTVNFKLDGVQP